MALTCDILRYAARRTGVHERDILGNARFKFVVHARWAVMAGLHRRGWSYARIGKLMKKDHTTIMYGVHKVNELVQHDSKFASIVDDIAGLQS